MSTYVSIPPDVWQAHLDEEGLWYPGCTATTRAKRPCKNPIFYGQVYTWDFEDKPRMSAKDWETFQRGLCPTHVHTGT